MLSSNQLSIILAVESKTPLHPSNVSVDRYYVILFF